MIVHSTREVARRYRLIVPVLAIIALTACHRAAPATPATSNPAASAASAAPPAPSGDSAPTIPNASTPASALAPTPTAAAVARGRELLATWKAAAGGDALTTFRSLELIGTSTMTGLRSPRRLTVAARYPNAFRLEEGPTSPNVPALRVAIGVLNDSGWMVGAVLAGDGRSTDPAVSRRAYTRAARQTMAGVMVGMNIAWLTDTGRYTVSDAGVADTGPDAGAPQLWLDGPDGRVGRIVFDPTTHLPRRLVEPPQPGGGGTAALVETTFTYSDIGMQHGYPLPKTIVRTNGTTITTWTMTTFGVNAKLPASRFAPGGR